MTIFQIILLAIVGLLLAATLTGLVKGWIGRPAGTLVTLIWIVAAAAVIWPKITTRVASAVGIGRGADLVLYCAIIVMMVGFFMTYVRLHRLQRDLTLLVRHVALDEARETSGKGEPGADKT